MFGQLWNRGWVSLVLALGGACGLWFAPAAATDAVRGAVRDAVGPGGRALAAARDQAQRAATRFAAYAPRWYDAVPQVVAPPVAAAAARDRERRLELQVAALRERLHALQDVSARRFPTESAIPLLRTTTVPARVLGGDRSTVVQLAERLIDAGGAEGLATSDLVVQAAYTADEPETPDAVIDQGADQSLTPDLPVAAGGVLVGRIRQAGRFTSTVQLVRDAGFRIAARLMRDTPEGPVFGAAGLFAGGGEEPCRLELIEGNSPVAVGDRVYTHEPLAGETIALLIGTVTTVELPPGATQWSITVTPACGEVPTQVEVLRVELNPARSPH